MFKNVNIKRRYDDNVIKENVNEKEKNKEIKDDR